ncbi:hypothetical protein N4R43_01520 [Lactococcus lactis]|uniref:hypothetical protein n=1 Tax=Lactococcus lactis TaxID=1358 RepID=UPI0029394532|nr:hypothetical protein [Lactococcus lactis]WOF40658.1 hypothetical protein N4R43_01520 [Lactococcus lactis]
MSKPNFINHEIVFNPTGNEFDECRGELLGSYQLVKIEDYEYKFIKQPQLTIPKSIADTLDVGGLMFLAWTHGNDLLGKVSDEERNAECRRRNAIAKAYLAGKALGVDLVKVVEG